MTQPKLITKPFAGDALPGYVNEIPKENPSGAPEQNASWSEGFPPITMTDIDDGGLPPNGEDMNGVLRAITEHNLFIGGGGVYKFTSEYVAEVGGYSKGAVLISDDKTELWMSIQDNNTQNFNGATKNQWRLVVSADLDSTLASIQSALNTKADKSVTITAGDGLTGGGTLAGNRVLAVNNTVVRTSRVITAGTGLSGGGNLSANRTLSVNYGTTAGTSAQGNDSRITGAAQKSANLSDLSSASAARQNLGLGTAATRNVGESSGNVMVVGAFGIGNDGAAARTRPSDIRGVTHSGMYQLAGQSGADYPLDGISSTLLQLNWENNAEFKTQIVHGLNNRVFVGARGVTAWLPYRELIHTGNILTTTGQSTEYPMTQKAVTDSLNTKVGLSGNQTIAGTKTFSSFPVTPSAAPTANYQAANKKYVDDKVAGSAIGVGQTWRNVTASRALDTTYTNTTGRPISVSALINCGSRNALVRVIVDGGRVMLQEVQGTAAGSVTVTKALGVTAIVPNGSTYRYEATELSAGGSGTMYLEHSAELR